MRSNHAARGRTTSNPRAKTQSAKVADVPHLVDALANHVAGLRAAGQLPPPRKKRRKAQAS